MMTMQSDNAYEIQMRKTDAAEAEVERLRAALRSALCPGGGFTGMPKDVEPTVGLCIDHKVCGCDLGAVLMRGQSASGEVK